MTDRASIASSLAHAPRLIGAAGVFCLLSGCIGTVTPEVRVTDVVLAERTSEGVVLNVEIEGANRSMKDLELRSVRYWLNLDGRRVFEARRSPQATFSALGIQSFEAPVAIPIDEAPLGESAAYTFGASIHYVVPGPLARTFYDLGLRRPSVRVTETGEITIPPLETSQ